MSLQRRVRSIRIATLLGAILLLFTTLLAGQTGNNSPATSSMPVIKASTHLVTVDVVVTDHHGAIVPGLTEKDFEVFEQVPGKKGQHEQKISQFEFVTLVSSAATAAKESPKIPTGVYTNLIVRRLPVPPTVLLVDGMNSDLDSGMQARRQMIKM